MAFDTQQSNDDVTITVTPLSIYLPLPKVRPVQNLSGLTLQTDELGNGKHTPPPPPPLMLHQPKSLVHIGE